MSATIAILRPYLEIVYFLSGILLLGGVVFTFLQVKLIKHDIRNRNIRMAAEKAIDACDRYFCEYIPLAAINFSEVKDKQIGSYDGPIGDFTNMSIPEALRQRCYKRFCLDSWAPAMNRLEAISAMFIAGVADECVGFQIMGRTFCRTIEHNYDVISMSRSEKAYPYWLNCVELYQLWRPRLSKAEIEAEVNTMKEIAEAIQDKKISPIGSV